MASPDPVPSPEQAAPVSFGTPEQKVSTELLAPPGWQKKVGSAKKGPSKRDVFFVAPDGEEIKSKRLLDRYLKNHPGGPAASDFDWSSGETPTRRSSRLITKTRPLLDSPKSGSGGKRQKKTVDEEKPEDEELEPELLRTEEPTKVPIEVPMSIEKVDNILEDVDVIQKKPVEGVPAETPSTTKETKLDEESELKSGSEVVEVSQGAQGDGEHKIEVISEINEPAKEAEHAHESSTVFPEEETGEHEEGPDKVSNVFQHCPEAPNASRQVDVST